MGGKASFLLVLGFSMIFLVAGHNFSSLSGRAVDNFASYYNSSMAHNIAVSGANIIANDFFVNSTKPDGSGNINYQGGTISYSLVTTDIFKNIKEITSVGTFNGESKTVKVVLQPSKFSKFAYFSNYEPSGIWWTSRDTVWGPFHTQGVLQVANEPVFYGKVTIKKYIKYYYGAHWDDPHFYGGFEKGVDLPLPTDGVTKLESAADAGGAKFTGQDTVYLNFQQDSLKFRFAYNDPDTTVHTASFAPNGVVFAKDAVVRLQGTVKGQYTLGVSGSYGKGRFYLDDDIVYSKEPDDPACTDLLGIVAKNDVYITDNTANHSDINIHGSVYCESGGFGAENYSSRPVSGFINLKGGIIQKDRRAVGTFNAYTETITAGFSKRYRYDNRLMISSPPFFPGTGSFEVISWYE